MTWTLDELKDKCNLCTKCTLHETRTNLVFGRGNEHARIMLIGEAPGRNEDLQGEPFVGAAGRTLERVLATADIDISEVFIANVLKCRPPNNRDPKPQEIAECSPYLDEQVKAIDPDVIVCLGRFAAQHILGSLAEGKAMWELQGRIYQVNGRYVVPVYHPAATIYDPSKLPDLTKSLQTVKSTILPRAQSTRHRDA